jgi:hypothetical protein
LDQENIVKGWWFSRCGDIVVLKLFLCEMSRWATVCATDELRKDLRWTATEKKKSVLQ